ncbi:MAG TPA: anti-sigma factor [Anaeromyxobacteraceae bacterium]|nr:anti-sigma factor [Anaeromyxobacteraceae bacterium]
MTDHLSDAQAQGLADGTLADGKRNPCEAHASACPECGALVRSYCALCEALGELDRPTLPEEFTDAVMSRIQAMEEARSWDRRLAVGILLVSGTIAALIFLLAGANAWAPALSGLFGKLGELAGTLALGASVLGPLVRALRLELALGLIALALPLLFGLSRLVPRRVEAVG